MFRTKKSRLKTVILGFLALLCLVPNSSLWASEIAQGAAELDDYVYDTKGDPHPAPVAFHHRLSLDSKQLGHPLRGLEDIAVTESKIYLATGQGIYVLDPELRFIEAWDHYEHEGTMRPLREVAGLYANHKGQIYACLPGEGRIVRFNEAGLCCPVLRPLPPLSLQYSLRRPPRLYRDGWLLCDGCFPDC